MIFPAPVPIPGLPRDRVSRFYANGEIADCKQHGIFQPQLQII